MEYVELSFNRRIAKLHAWVEAIVSYHWFFWANLVLSQKSWLWVCFWLIWTVTVVLQWREILAELVCCA